jgi:hypothetical protein
LPRWGWGWVDICRHVCAACTHWLAKRSSMFCCTQAQHHAHAFQTAKRRRGSSQAPPTCPPCRLPMLGSSTLLRWLPSAATPTACQTC